MNKRRLVMQIAVLIVAGFIVYQCYTLLFTISLGMQRNGGVTQDLEKPNQETLQNSGKKGHYSPRAFIQSVLSDSNQSAPKSVNHETNQNVPSTGQTGPNSNVPRAFQIGPHSNESSSGQVRPNSNVLSTGQIGSPKIFFSGANQSVASSPSQTKVIVLGYKHGGSSFTGAIVQSHPKVFYVYEPVWYMKDPDNHGISVSNKSVPLIARLGDEWRGDNNAPEPLHLVRSLLDCNITQYTRSYVKYNVESRLLQTLDDCVKRNPRGMDKCYSDARNTCRQRQVTSMKTVRLSVSEVGQLMAVDPSLKLLYVVRDPRGINSSRMFSESGQKETEMFNRQAIKLRAYPNEPQMLEDKFGMQCQIMNKDVESLLAIAPKFKGRTFAVRYEDLADEPMKLAAQIFNFLNLDFSEASKNMLNLMTSSKKPQGQVRGMLVKPNSSSTSTKWRTKLPFHMAKEIESKCHYVFEVMKYRLFPTEKEMRDLNVPMRERHYGDGFENTA